MFAYGVPELCPPVDLVTGPGNIYVVAAKRLLEGKVNIDSEAGPTEIAVLADRTADPVHVAADLISQAEHDPQAAAVLVTDSTGAGRARSRPSSPTQVAGGQARRTDQPGPDRPAVRAWCWSTTWPRGSTWSTRTRPSTWRSRPPTPRSVAGRITNAGAIFVGTVVAGVAGRLLRRQHPRAAHGAAAPATPRGST